MSNFTKSIFYSGAVLAVAMIAVFSIYTNMTQKNDLGAIEPAAGEETMTEEQGALQQAGDYIAEKASNAAEAAKDMTEQAAENAGNLAAEQPAEQSEEAAPQATEAAKAAGTEQMTEEAPKTVEPAAGEKTEETTEGMEDTAQ